jgi:hypothetical protein
MNPKFMFLLHGVTTVLIQEISLPLAGPIGGCDDFNFPTDDCFAF